MSHHQYRTTRSKVTLKQKVSEGKRNDCVFHNKETYQKVHSKLKNETRLTCLKSSYRKTYYTFMNMHTTLNNAYKKDLTTSKAIKSS